jgi:hypothetical protein
MTALGAPSRRFELHAGGFRLRRVEGTDELDHILRRESKVAADELGCLPPRKRSMMSTTRAPPRMVSGWPAARRGSIRTSSLRVAGRMRALQLERMLGHHDVGSLGQASLHRRRRRLWGRWRPGMSQNSSRGPAVRRPPLSSTRSGVSSGCQRARRGQRIRFRTATAVLSPWVRSPWLIAACASAWRGGATLPTGLHGSEARGSLRPGHDDVAGRDRREGSQRVPSPWFIAASISPNTLQRSSSGSPRVPSPWLIAA